MSRINILKEDGDLGPLLHAHFKHADGVQHHIFTTGTQPKSKWKIISKNIILETVYIITFYLKKKNSSNEIDDNLIKQR